MPKAQRILADEPHGNKIARMIRLFPCRNNRKQYAAAEDTLAVPWAAPTNQYRHACQLACQTLAG